MSNFLKSIHRILKLEVLFYIVACGFLIDIFFFPDTETNKNIICCMVWLALIYSKLFRTERIMGERLSSIEKKLKNDKKQIRRTHVTSYYYVGWK